MNAHSRIAASEAIRLQLLEEVHRCANVSQRALAERVGVAVGAVNRYLRDLIRGGYVRVVDSGVRPFAYRLTARGRAYCQGARHAQYEHAVESFREMEGRIAARLGELRRRGAKRVVFYGAGVVMEVALPLAKVAGLEVAGVVDDDPAKHGRPQRGLRVFASGALNSLAPDAVVITTFRHAREIQRKIEPGLRSSVLVWEL